MKKLLCMFAVCVLAATSLSATVGWEFGVGSGYMYYGSSETRARNRQISDANQILLHANAGTLFKLAPALYFCFGVDTMTDFRWKGSDHVNSLDYAAVMGFHLYPGLSGLMFSTEYALGRRTDFVSINNADDETIHSTQWGNGFKFALAYDFAKEGVGLAPAVGASWRHMPRGGSSDEIIAVFIRLSEK